MANNVELNEEYKVEKIEGSGITDGRLYFSVKYAHNLGPNLKSAMVWADEMPNAQEAIADYCKKVGVANTQQLTSHYLAAEYSLRKAKEAMEKMEEEEAKLQLQKELNGSEKKARKYKKQYSSTSSSGAPSCSSSGAPSTSNS